MTAVRRISTLCAFERLDAYMRSNYNVRHLEFEWDTGKASRNASKHGIQFEEAATAFLDPLGRLIADPDHSEGEDRFLLLGLSANERLLVIAHAYRGAGEAIRLISARRATPRERSDYGH